MEIEILLKYGFRPLPFNYFEKNSMRIKVWEDGSMSYHSASLETEEQLKIWYKGNTGEELILLDK